MLCLGSSSQLLDSALFWRLRQPMGFDPRQWSSVPLSPANANASPAIWSLCWLKTMLSVKKCVGFGRELDTKPPFTSGFRQTSASVRHKRLTTRQLTRPMIQDLRPLKLTAWGQVLTQQVGWGDLRLRSLSDLIERLNRSSFHPQLNLYQRLDRLLPGFGRELFAAMSGSMTKKRCAVLAAFAFYGVRASEWLNEEPQRVVHELLNRQEPVRSGRRTRSDQRSTDRKRDGSFGCSLNCFCDFGA